MQNATPSQRAPAKIGALRRLSGLTLTIAVSAISVLMAAAMGVTVGASFESALRAVSGDLPGLPAQWFSSMRHAACARAPVMTNAAWFVCLGCEGTIRFGWRFLHRESRDGGGRSRLQAAMAALVRSCASLRQVSDIVILQDRQGLKRTALAERNSGRRRR